jgi:hypothetical protein
MAPSVPLDVSTRTTTSRGRANDGVASNEALKVQFSQVFATTVVVMDVGVTLRKIAASSVLSGRRSRDMMEVLESYLSRTCIAQSDVRML